MRNIFSLMLSVFVFIAVGAAASADQFSAADENDPARLILSDTDSIYSEITSFTYEENSHEYVAEIYLENRSSDSIEFGAEKIGVCGFISDAYCYDVLAGNRRCITYLEINADSLQQLDISPDEISFTFYVNKTENGSSTPLISKDVLYYPTGKTSKEIERKDLKDFLYSQYEMENDFLRFKEIDAKWTDNEEFYEIDFAIHNKCPFDYIISTGNLNINYSPADSYMFCYVPAGMNALAHIWIPKESFDSLGTYEVDTVSFTLLLYDDTEAYRTGSNTIPFFAYPIYFQPAKG